MNSKPIEILILSLKQQLINTVNAEEFKNIPLIIKQMCFNEVKTELDIVTQKVINQIMQQEEIDCEKENNDTTKVDLLKEVQKK